MSFIDHLPRIDSADVNSFMKDVIQYLDTYIELNSITNTAFERSITEYICDHFGITVARAIKAVPLFIILLYKLYIVYRQAKLLFLKGRNRLECLGILKCKRE